MAIQDLRERIASEWRDERDGKKGLTPAVDRCDAGSTKRKASTGSRSKKKQRPACAISGPI